MRKIKSLIFVLVIMLVCVFSINLTSYNASAVTKHKKKTQVKSLAKKTSKKVKHTKLVKKSSKKAKHTKLVKKSSRKAAKKKHSKRKTSNSLRRIARSNKIYCRGSGRALGVGNVMKVIEYAKKYLGVNYRFGRSSSKAFDCSGFTMFIYKAAGVHLPHSAAAQANLGIAVDKSHLKPGDLVFFETYKRGISHVGMYIGKGHFIHASSGKGEVTITSLSDAYYVQRFRGSTRLLVN